MLFHAQTTPSIFMPVTDRGHVVVVDQFRWGANRVIREIPGGNPKGSQTPEDVVRAELAEETGYAPGRMILLTPNPIYFEPAAFTVPYWPYLVLGCRKIGEPKPDETEFIEVLTFPLEEFLGMIWAGQVQDSKTIAITFLALPHLRVRMNLPRF
jgi:ADP-ribose pyrophosphatase